MNCLISSDPSIGANYTVNSPLHVSGVVKVTPTRAPNLGEHTRTVLQELKFTSEEIGRLYSSKAVSQAEELGAA